jgi:quercetin dioxygenase-like cupin family protein
MPDLKIDEAWSVPARDVTTEGAEGVTIRWLISKNDGAPRFQMRLFEVAPGGRTPLHAHEWEHEVFILEGEGVLMFEGDEKPFSKGHFVFVPEGREHSFNNTGKSRLAFLCMVPV